MFFPYALANALSLIGYTVAFWGWGTLVDGKNLAPWWRPALGAAIVAVIAPAAYYHGLHPGVTGRIIFGVGAVGVGVGFWRRAIGSGMMPVSLGLGAVLVALMLWLPLAIGGAQFGVFHSNPYDALNYLSSTAATIREPYAVVTEAQTADQLKDPLIANTRFWMGLRYAVVDVYALWQGVAPSAMPVSAGGMLAAFLLALYFAAAGLLAAVLKRWQRGLAVIAAALVLGFWGQLQLDLNSWGWVMAAPLEVAMFGLLVEWFTEAPNQAAISRGRRAVVLGVVGAGWLHLYYEMALFFIPAIVVGILASWLHRREIPSVTRTLGLALAVMLLVLLPAGPLLVSSLVKQWNWASTMNTAMLDWVWQGVIAPGVSPASAGGLALRWVGLVGGAGWAPQAGLRIAGDAATLLAGAVALFTVWRAGRRRPELVFLGLAVATIAGMTIAFWMTGRPWLAFKSITYLSVIAWPLLILPFVLRRPLWQKLPAGLVLVASLALALLRLGAAQSENGLYYRDYRYVAPLDPVLKEARSWVLPELGPALADARAVKIDVPDSWLEAYAMTVADAQRLPFFKTTPVTDLWHFSNRDVGRQPAIPDYDALIYVEYDFASHRAGLGLARRDGRIFSTQRPAHLVRIQTAAALDSRGGLLAWSLQARTGFSTAQLTVECDRAGAYQLNLTLTPPAELQGRTQLAVSGEGGPPVVVAIATQGAGVMQGVKIPLSLQRGRNVLTVTLQSPPDTPPAESVLWLTNPRLEPRPVR